MILLSPTQFILTESDVGFEGFIITNPDYKDLYLKMKNYLSRFVDVLLELESIYT